MQQSEGEHRQKELAIERVVEQELRQTDFVATAEEVQRQGKKQTEFNVSLATVYKVLKKDLQMSYRKINLVALHSNSIRNLVLR